MTSAVTWSMRAMSASAPAVQEDSSSGGNAVSRPVSPYGRRHGAAQDGADGVADLGHVGGERAGLGGGDVGAQVLGPGAAEQRSGPSTVSRSKVPAASATPSPSSRPRRTRTSSTYPPPPGTGPDGTETHAVTDRRGVATGTTVMVLTQLVMIAVMTMTPVHMQAHGHGTQMAGLVIALHVGAMFVPSPLTGQLVDRLGPRPVAAASGVTLLSAGALAALAPPHAVPGLAVALVLLGLGWNFGLLSGTALVTAALPPDTRAAGQGLVDVGIAVAGATGGMASGVVTASGGFPVLAFGGGVLALAVLPVLLVAARPSRTRR